MSISTELKDVVLGSTFSQKRENGWLDRFFSEFTFDDASEAVKQFLHLARAEHLWSGDKTPLAIRRSLKKTGSAEPASLTVMCRLEGKIRDNFRSKRRKATTEATTTEATTTEATTTEATTTDAALRVARLQGMAVMLRGIVYWLDDPGRASLLPRLFLRRELELAAMKIKEQLDNAA